MQPCSLRGQACVEPVPVYGCGCEGRSLIRPGPAAFAAVGMPARPPACPPGRLRSARPCALSRCHQRSAFLEEASFVAELSAPHVCPLSLIRRWSQPLHPRCACSRQSRGRHAQAVAASALTSTCPDDQVKAAPARGPQEATSRRPEIETGRNGTGHYQRVPWGHSRRGSGRGCPCRQRPRVQWP